MYLGETWNKSKKLWSPNANMQSNPQKGVKGRISQRKSKLSHWQTKGNIATKEETEFILNTLSFLGIKNITCTLLFSFPEAKRVFSLHFDIVASL